jgi:hypothetical protein
MLEIKGVFDRYLNTFRFVWRPRGSDDSGENNELGGMEWVSYLAYFLLFSGVVLLVSKSVPEGADFTDGVVFPFLMSLLLGLGVVVLFPLALMAFLRIFRKQPREDDDCNLR